MAHFSDAPDEYTTWGAPRCAARKKDGTRCGRAASKNLDICVAHGAGFSNNRNLAAKRQADIEARAYLARTMPQWDDNPPEILNAVQEMARLAGRNKMLTDVVFHALHPQISSCEMCGTTAGTMDPAALVAWTMVEKALANNLTAMDRMATRDRQVEIDDRMLSIIATAQQDAWSHFFPDVTETVVLMHGYFMERVAFYEQNQKLVGDGRLYYQSRAGTPGYPDEDFTSPGRDASDDMR